MRVNNFENKSGQRGAALERAERQNREGQARMLAALGRIAKAFEEVRAAKVELYEAEQEESQRLEHVQDLRVTAGSK